MRARLLLFDLDGTLLTPAREIHPRSLAALGRLMRAGVLVGLATGRPPRSLRAYAEALRPNGPIICFNGCRVLVDDRVLFDRALPLDLARAALEVAEDLGVHANLYIDDEAYIEAVTPTSRASAIKDSLEQIPVGRLSAWLRSPPTKILFITAPDHIEELRAALRARCPEGACELVRSTDEYLELLPAGVSKGAALDEAAAALGIAHDEIVAFGDNLNDLELLERAGLGIAMANAAPELKAAADRVIGPNDGPAIADLLDALPLEDGALILE